MLKKRIRRSFSFRGRVALASAICLLILWASPHLEGYSVLSHEAVIDSAWESQIKPLLLIRYPALNEEQLTEARAHAYGGCIIQDMGYYPFGSRFFSDLLHYV